MKRGRWEGVGLAGGAPVASSGLGGARGNLSILSTDTVRRKARAYCSKEYAISACAQPEASQANSDCASTLEEILSQSLSSLLPSNALQRGPRPRRESRASMTKEDGTHPRLRLRSRKEVRHDLLLTHPERSHCSALIQRGDE